MKESLEAEGRKELDRDEAEALFGEGGVAEDYENIKFIYINACCRRHNCRACRKRAHACVCMRAIERSRAPRACASNMRACMRMRIARACLRCVATLHDSEVAS